MGTENRFKPGDTVQHFKRETLSDQDRAGRKYLYEIVGVAIHSETREEMMVYKPLYDDGDMFVRPLEMFLSEVDHEKYPDVKQKYRFEKVKTVPLRLIIHSIEEISDEWVSFLDKEKMQVVSLPAEPWLFDDEEEFDELSDMIDEGFGTRFFKLPDETDINKYNIMQEFIEILPDEEMRLYLDDEIHQRGAHRRFRDGIRHYGIEDDWYDFLHESHIRIAREWCDRNGFSYTEQEGNE